jgi:hypothetical protein
VDCRSKTGTPMSGECPESPGISLVGASGNQAHDLG